MQTVDRNWTDLDRKRKDFRSSQNTEYILNVQIQFCDHDSLDSSNTIPIVPSLMSYPFLYPVNWLIDFCTQLRGREAATLTSSLACHLSTASWLLSLLRLGDVNS